MNPFCLPDISHLTFARLHRRAFRARNSTRLLLTGIDGDQAEACAKPAACPKRTTRPNDRYAPRAKKNPRPYQHAYKRWLWKGRDSERGKFFPTRPNESKPQRTRSPSGGWSRWGHCPDASCRLELGDSVARSVWHLKPEIALVLVFANPGPEPSFPAVSVCFLAESGAAPAPRC